MGSGRQTVLVFFSQAYKAKVRAFNHLDGGRLTLLTLPSAVLLSCHGTVELCGETHLCY